jgi:transposase-like protein
MDAAANPLPKTLIEAVRYFSDLDTCVAYLAGRRWPNGVTCPTCGNSHVRFDRKRRVWTCNTKHPKRQFSVKVGTIFEDSPLGLDKWLPAVWMIAGAKNGISSHELGRALGVTQKSAWFMLHRIRLSMQAKNGGGKLDGTVEVDETYIGGKARNMHFKKREALKLHGRSTQGKIAVVGLLQRHSPEATSQVRLEVAERLDGRAMHGRIREHVTKGATVNTDAFRSYASVAAEYTHNVIDHAERYVDGNVHTNGVENFWSLLKRTIGGTYVSVEPFHLFRYLDEQAFRFNKRDGNDATRFESAIGGIVGRRLTYDALTANEGRESL